MPGLVPGIHTLRYCRQRTWMAGTSPAMTRGDSVPWCGELTKDSLKTVLQAYIDAFAAHVAKHHG